MKKIFSFILISLLSLFIIGCDTGGKPSTPTPENKPCQYHIDDDNNGICDVCGTSLNTTCKYHIDDDHNGICDVCGENLASGENTLNGYYLLNSKTVSGVDYLEAALLDVLYFNNNTITNIVVDLAGKHETKGSYQLDNQQLVIKYGVYEYQYTISEDKSVIAFDGLINRKKVVMQYQYQESYQLPTDSGSVSITEELFGDDINENFYNYCPTVIMEGSNIMHVWYCGNKNSGNVTDYIMYRKGILHSDGKWVFSSKQIALEHGEAGTWDSRHACDPSVIKGIFNYNGEEYHYLMAYLGCKTSNVTCNEVGIALAKDASGPWVKVGDGATAFRSYYDSTEFGSDGANYWGYGQPSLVSVDKAGRVLLFYTKGIKLGTYTYVEEWNFSDLNNPVLIREAKLADGGAIGTVNNADFAYDPIEKAIYCLKEDHENGWYPDDGGVNWISGSNSLFYFNGLSSDEHYSDALFRSYSWAKVATIGPSQTGYSRNHNCGIITNEYGWIINYQLLPVAYTMSELATSYPGWSGGGQWPALHTYRIHGYIIEK